MQALSLRLPAFDIRGKVRWRNVWFLPLSAAAHLALLGAALWTGPSTIIVPSHLPQIELALPPPEPPPPVPIAEPVKAPAPTPAPTPTPAPPKVARMVKPQPHLVTEPKAITATSTEPATATESTEAAPPTPAPAAVSQPATDVLTAYIGQVRAIMEKAKHYPPEARYDGQEGTVWLRFSLARSGALTDWRIQTSSGVSSLDEEAGRMVKSAAPFPPFPTALTRDGLELVVPVRFSLKSS